jgi:hypothetical protein
MKVFCSFAWALINAGGRVAPDAPVTGKDLFGVVMAAGVGYIFGWLLIEIWALARSKWAARQPPQHP